MSPRPKKTAPPKPAGKRGPGRPRKDAAAPAAAVEGAEGAAPAGKAEGGSGEGMKRLMAKGRAKGFLTYQDVNDALPDEVVSSEQIDDVLSMLGEEGIEFRAQRGGVELHLVGRLEGRVVHLLQRGAGLGLLHGFRRVGRGQAEGRQSQQDSEEEGGEEGGAGFHAYTDARNRRSCKAETARAKSAAA